MKYVIFEDDKTGLKQPVVFGDHTVHSSINVERSHPISGGFFMIGKYGTVTTYGTAESLGLQPQDGDDGLLFCVLQNMGTMFFL